MTDDTPYAVAFSHVLGIGPMKYQQILNTFGSPQKAYMDSGTKMQRILGDVVYREYASWKSLNNPITLLDGIVKKDIQVVEYGSMQYPEQLRVLRDPPICLYVKGNPEHLKKQEKIFSIVGTRMASSYGRFIAESIARDLSRQFIIASGLALGIDGVAHRAAIESGGKTIAVLGCGVDVIYPAEHRSLYYQILKAGSTIISEFPPGRTVLKGLFVARNRIISALGRGVLVVEGAVSSGSLITAKYAAEQGRDVFAVPADATSAMGKGPNLLLKEGATVTTSAEDIYNYYSMTSSSKDRGSYTDPNVANFVRTLEQEPMTIDLISTTLQMSLSDTLLVISQLELDGIVQKQADGLYYLI